MTIPDCDKCFYFQSANEERGICRRRRPDVFLIDSAPSADGRPSFLTISVYPEMPSKGDGCGEFVADIASFANKEPSNVGMQPVV